MSDETRSKGMPDTFDRLIGGLHGLPDVVSTKPTTIRTLTPLLGQAQTFIVQTYRQLEVGDNIFLECVSGDGSFRLAIPPKVADAIARQREALSAAMRSKVAKRLANERKERGEVPGFMRGNKRSKAVKVLEDLTIAKVDKLVHNG